MLRHNQKYLDIIYKYYSKDIHPGGEEYLYSPEYKAYLALQEQCREDTGRFDRLLEEIGKDLDVDVLPRFISTSYVAMFYMTERIGFAKYERCIIIISGMLNVFSVYLGNDNKSETTLMAIRSREELDLVNRVTGHVMKIYPEYEPFDMNYYYTRVPGIYATHRYNDYATYYERLLADWVN